MQSLAPVEGLVVTQKKEWGEIITGFETKNAYTVADASGRELYAAVEEGGFFLWRWILKALRPFVILVLALDQRPVIKAVRPFRFFFHEISVFDASNDRLLGTIKRRFSILRRKYSVIAPNGNEIYQLFGPILHPWTFEILDESGEYGKITKEWSGLLKEGFTDADNFGVIFPADWPVQQKALFMGAVFLIDFVHFEDKSGGNGFSFGFGND